MKYIGAVEIASMMTGVLIIEISSILGMSQVYFPASLISGYGVGIAACRLSSRKNVPHYLGWFRAG